MSSRPRLSRAEGSNLPSIIGATCAFDTKKYKNVDTVFDVSACGEKNKKIFKFLVFVFNYHRFWSKFRNNNQYRRSRSLGSQSKMSIPKDSVFWLLYSVFYLFPSFLTNSTTFSTLYHHFWPKIKHIELIFKKNRNFLIFLDNILLWESLYLIERRIAFIAVWEKALI